VYIYPQRRGTDVKLVLPVACHYGTAEYMYVMGAGHQHKELHHSPPMILVGQQEHPLGVPADQVISVVI